MFKLPSLNRRNLLLGLAAASAAATSTAALAVATGTSEAPALIALGDALPAAEADMLEAERAYIAIYRKWQPRWPLAPDEITFSGSGYHSNCEKGIDGGSILANGERPSSKPGAERPRNVDTADYFRHRLRSVDKTLVRRRPKHPLTAAEIAELQAYRADMALKLALAERYEADKAHVLAASGFEVASQRQRQTRDALAVIVGQIMAIEPRTMVGVVIQAQALTSWGKNPLHAFHIEGMRWPQQLAASMLRIAGEGPADQA